MHSKLPKERLYPILALIVVNILWGAANPVIKYTLSYIPPLTFLFLRMLIVCIVLLPYVVIELHRQKVNPKDYFNLFLLGVFSQTALALAFYGLNYTTALDATIIGITSALLTVVAGHYFYNEKVDTAHKWGFFLASIGSVVIVLEPILTHSGSDLTIDKRMLGNFLTVLYSFSWVIYIIWSKMSMGERSGLLKKTLSFIHIRPMTKAYSPTLLSALTFYVGLVTFIPLALWEQTSGSATNTGIAFIDWRGVLGLVYMALLSSVVAYLLNQWAVEKAKVSDISILTSVGTVVAFPAAFLLLGEIPNTYVIIGGVLIMIGVIVAEKHKS